METTEFINAIKNGLSINSTLESGKIDFLSLMESDINTLNAFCKNIELFHRLSLTESWLPGKSRQKTLGQVDLFNKYLDELKVHTCTCTKFKYLSPDPISEQEDGLIKIASHTNSTGGAKYECICNNCCKTFEVFLSVDSMGYDDYQWNEN